MAESGFQKRCFGFGGFRLYPQQRLLEREGTRVPLTPRVFDLLLVLVEHAGDAVSKEDILTAVWPGSYVEEGNINRAISTLRKYLGKQANGGDFIETVSKLGYRFVAEVFLLEDDDEERQIHSLRRQTGKSEPRTVRTIRTKQLAAFLVVVIVALGFVSWRLLRPAGKAASELNELLEPQRLTNSIENEQAAGWTNDGKIAYVRWKDEKTAESYFMNADGSAAQKASGISELRQGFWSPDGNNVVFWKYGDDSGSYLAKADGSDATKLPLSAENICWSADSTKFAFQSNPSNAQRQADYEIFVYALATRKVVQLTKNSSFDGDPGWSPNGRQIVFDSDREGNFEIYSMNADGGEPKRLTTNSGHDSFPKFSPDGTQILFNSNMDSETTDIYLMNSDGAGVRRLTDWKSNELTRNGWSPDGTKIAFNSDRDGNDDIYIMSVEAFRPKLIAADEKANLQTPMVSPDGKSIVYSAELEDKTGELRLIDIDSNRERVLLKTSSSSNYPRWSPDGRWIAFHQEVDGKWDVFKFNTSTNEVVNLTNNPASDSVPTWSPDGEWIYFRSNRNGDTQISEIFRMNADGTGQTPLPVAKGFLGWCASSPNGVDIVFAGDRENDPGRMFDLYVSRITDGKERLLAARTGNEIQPTYSFDGGKVAFVASSDGNPEIYSVNSDGTGALRLTRNAASDISPTFAPDGKRLFFASNRSGKYAIYEIEVP